MLLAQRPAGKLRAGYWEFPGGKVESGESDDEALLRELWEELGVRGTVQERIGTHRHRYSEELQIELHLYRVCLDVGDTPVGREDQAVDWVPLNTLDEETLCEADRPLFRRARASSGETE